MSLDDSKRNAWVGLQLESAKRRSAEPDLPLYGGGGGGTSDTMDARVTRLEVRMEHVDRTLASIDSKLDKANDRLMQLPTKTELSSWKLQWTALALAVVAVVIGGIIGGLAWIQPSPSAPAPTIIQLPSTRP